MEPKKNPKVDIHKKRSVIFPFSLALSLIMVICAFKIVAPERHAPKRPDPPKEDFFTVSIPVTIHTEEPKVQPMRNKPRVQKTPDLSNIRVVEVTHEVPDHTPVDQSDEFVEALPTFEIPAEEPTDSIFIIVEYPPVPLGGYSAFYKQLSENIKYPRRAKQRDVTGKVFVSFTVDRSGNVQEVEVLKGIGTGCDEEAKRVIGMTKWVPGKQRGKPVRVRMVLPVVFELQR